MKTLSCNGKEHTPADPEPDDAEIVAALTAIRSRITPPIGAAMLYNLMYAVGFTRISGSVEGADAVDPAGTGKIHRHSDSRADDTMQHFPAWITHGAHSEHTRSSIAIRPSPSSTGAPNHPSRQSQVVHNAQRKFPYIHSQPVPAPPNP
ncbi:hypothetical protein [Mycobacterium simiae]|uniref:Uncharacterized protein n=1 Tax=Mycobacterium simiae TaxID=1784 RepID=A0A1X0XIA8_MYCSI|nr:hypothetical protein [Mycobacterium simiae]ORJ52568.1 hypothetical protein B5M45_30735 [Mycobacterium simiae]